MILSEFLSNAEVVNRLERMFSGARLPHAFLIEGPVGSGRRTLARIIAEFAACTGADAPCGRCPACLSGESNPDIVQLVAQKQMITVGDVRNVRNQAYVKANQSAKKVFIIPDAQLMNQQAQNALLKVLEEPPADVIFILTCEFSKQLLDTVLSRVCILKLAEIEKQETVDYICERFAKYKPEEVEAAFAGTVGATLSVLEGQTGYTDAAEEIARKLFGSELELHKAMYKFEKDRPAQKGIAAALEVVFNDALAMRMGAKRDCSAQDIRRTLSESFTAEQLLNWAKTCARAQSDAESNMGGALFITDFCARIFAAVQ